jgi:hypothetical protein
MLAIRADCWRVKLKSPTINPRFRTRLSLRLQDSRTGTGASISVRSLISPSSHLSMSPFSVGIPPSTDQMMTTGVCVYASHTHTSSELYTRKGQVQEIPGLDLARVRDPAERRISHTSMAFFLKSVTIRSACFRIHCNLHFIRACWSRQVLEQ